MSRRDTIIIAVLVNAGLLLVLFVTAIRSDKGSSVQEPQIVQSEISLPKPVGPDPSSTRQEEETIDALLNQYAAVPTLDSKSPEELSLTGELATSFPVEEELAPLRPTPSSESNYISVTVKKGDALEKIARHNGSTVSAIMNANNLSSTQLKIGQVLKVPSKGGSTFSPTAPSSQGESEYYVVKEGDSPWLIASKNHIKLDDLLRLNQLDEQKAKRLHPGDRLRIR